MPTINESGGQKFTVKEIISLCNANMFGEQWTPMVAQLCQQVIQLSNENKALKEAAQASAPIAEEVKGEE